MKRIVLVLLALCLLTSSVLAAPMREPEKPETPEKIEYVYPDDWSRDALMFAVENGILAGDENHNLNPRSNITRAEMAAVLVRLLGATQETSLSAFTDVLEGAWYVKELSAAVKAGIFGGVSDTEMMPNAAITREQAVVVLCRAFGIVDTDRTAYQEFTDGSQISDYARDSVSAMRKQKLVGGYDDGSFQPRNSITRAEVAQLLYNIFDVIADKPEDIPAKGWVLYRGTQALPETLTLQGTLTVGQALSSIKAADWQISDAVLLRGGEKVSADLSGLKTAKLVCAPLSGAVSAEVPELWLSGSGVTFTGSCDTLTVMTGAHTLTGDAGTLTLRAGSLALTGHVGTATLAAETKLTLVGSADEITVAGKNVTLDGKGHVKKLILKGGGSKLDVTYDELDNTWYETYGKDYENALKIIKTQLVPCTVKKRTGLYKSEGGYGTPIRYLEKDSIVYNEFHPAGNWFYVSLADGTKGWVYRWDCYIPDDPPGATDGDLDYSDAVKEGFVDQMRYSSKTNYMVWISRYTQKVIVYRGSQGNWKVHKTFPCSSGMNNCPTPAGIFAIYADGGAWYFDNYYVTDVTLFNSDIAFHTILFNYNGTVFDGTLGYPASHGCIRMKVEDAKYMKTLPIGTTVVVY